VPARAPMYLTVSFCFPSACRADHLGDTAGAEIIVDIWRCDATMNWRLPAPMLDWLEKKKNRFKKTRPDQNIVCEAAFPKTRNPAGCNIWVSLSE